MASTDAYLGLPPVDSRVADPSARRGRTYVREILTRDPPGPPLDNRWTQTTSYTGVAYLCIRSIAEGLAGATVRVTRKRKRSKTSTVIRKALPTPHAESNDHDYVPVDGDHPLCRLFEDPNAVDTFQDFITDWVIQQELTGEAIIWPLEDRLGNPRELWVIPPALTQQIPISGKYPCGGLYVYSFYPGFLGTIGANSASVELDNRDLLRCRNRHPLYRWTGYSPLTGGGVQMDVLNSIDQARKQHMDNGFSPDVFVGLDGGTQDEVDKVTARLDAKYGGSRGRRVIVANSEGMDVKLLSTAAKDMEYAGGWDQMVKFACALWQTSSGVLGLTEADSYAAFYARLKQHHTLCLRPRARRIGAFLTKHLARPYYGDEYAIELDLPQIEDQQLLDSQLKQDADLGTITYNQYLGHRSREPVEGGDLPVSVYMSMLEAKTQPKPEPGPVAAQQPISEPAQAPVPRPENESGSNSLPPRKVVKSMIAGALRGLE